MREPGEITTHSDEGRTPLAFTVDSNRVHHYSDIIDYMAKTEVRRCQTEENFTPTEKQVEFLKKELIRHAVIRRDVVSAQQIRINKSNILKS
jgi:hypothetical protein